MATPVKPWEAKASTGLEQGKLQQSTANANSLPPIVPQRPTTSELALKICAIHMYMYTVHVFHFPRPTNVSV